MEPLVNTLKRLEGKLKANEEMRVSKEDERDIVERLMVAGGARGRMASEVSIVAQVHTYVQQVHKGHDSPWNSTVVVPAFASHWGIVVGSPGARQFLYHFIFTEAAESNAPSSTVANDKIRFNTHHVTKPLSNTKLVGTTSYSMDELMTVGENMIKAFGNYHRVFWNCQTFAKCYLRVVTVDQLADFDDWTAADTSRLFMCAFIVGAPFATTGRLKEKAKVEGLMKAFDSLPRDRDVMEQSEYAISAIYNAVKKDWWWGCDIGQLSDETGTPGFLERLFKYLFGGSRSENK
jgi:hypothetical protein